MRARYKVDITHAAEGDLREIFAYISHDDTAAAARWTDEIERQIVSLESFPMRCPVIPESQELGREYRHLVSGNYRTLFKIAGKKVIIMRVIHGARLLDMEMLK